MVLPPPSREHSTAKVQVLPPLASRAQPSAAVAMAAIAIGSGGFLRRPTDSRERCARSDLFQEPRRPAPGSRGRDLPSPSLVAALCSPPAMAASSPTDAQRKKKPPYWGTCNSPFI
jgi:hypothetical protein